MYLLHCLKCHHEWLGHEDDLCDWCKGGSYILREEKPFGEMLLEEVVSQVTTEKD